MKKSGFYSAGFYITNHTVRVFSFFRNEFCPFHSNHDEGNQDEMQYDTRNRIGDCAGQKHGKVNCVCATPEMRNRATPHTMRPQNIESNSVS